MYAKVFRRMFNGPLGDTWEAWTTFVAMLAFSDADGVVDMTVGALVRQSGLPREAVEKGLAILSAPDPRSSIKDEEGRRIVPMAEGEDCGWLIVNHRTYQRDMRTAEEVRQANRERQQRRREQLRKVADSEVKGPSVTHQSQPVTHGSRTGHSPSHTTDYKLQLQATVNHASHDSSAEVVMMLPCTGGAEWPLTKDLVAELAKLYPGVDVEAESRKMRGWLMANPRRRKTVRGVLSFVNSWLAREQDRPKPATKPGSRSKVDAEYLEHNLGGGE